MHLWMNPVPRYHLHLPMRVATGGRWLLGERKWLLAAIFQEVDVDDGWEMKTEAIYCRVAVTAACVRVPLGGLGMRLRSGPNMHCRTYPADKGEAHCFYSKATPSPSVP